MKVIPKKINLKDGRNLTLRSATPGDAENLLRHLRITHAESYKNLNQSTAYWQEFTTIEEEKILAGFESASEKFMLVAVYDGRIVGGLGFWGYQSEFVKRSAGIGMSIQKEFCGSGLGTEMMYFMINQAKQMGFHRIDLTVRTYNEAGIKLYEKVGFERVGLLKDAAFIDEEYVNEYSYQKILD